MPKQPLSRKRVASEDLESDDGIRDAAPKQKKSKVAAAPVSLEPQTGDDGKQYWELSQARRVQVSQLNATTLVNIREYYEKDGSWLPGKKGIALTIEQFNNLVRLLPQLETALKDKGLEVKRPEYESASKSADSDLDDAPARKKIKAKPNHEATSDEDDD